MKNLLFAILIFLLFVPSVSAQGPTETPVPTPTPLPANVHIESVGALNQDNVSLFIAACWAVIILYALMSLVWDAVKMQNSFLIVLIASFPIVLANIIYWALTIYFWMAVIAVVYAFQSLGKRR